VQRSTFLAGAAIPLAACATAACASNQADTIGLVETASQFDTAAFHHAVETHAEVRQVWDAGELRPTILGAVKNSLNGLQFGFGVAPSDTAVAFVAHSRSNLMLYDNGVWERYRLGDLFEVKDPNGNVIASNIFAISHATAQMADPGDVRSFYQDASIVTLQRRGVRFFICNTALVEQAYAIVNARDAGGSSVDDVARDLREHLLPGVMLVPSGVATVAYLQSRYRYTYATE
jgi:intracellular sulfur oxidation DsrE/DsrF family protein